MGNLKLKNPKIKAEKNGIPSLILPSFKGNYKKINCTVFPFSCFDWFDLAPSYHFQNVVLLVKLCHSKPVDQTVFQNYFQVFEGRWQIQLYLWQSTHTRR